MPLVRRAHSGRPSLARGCGRARGQSLAEFALILPIIAVLVGACLDLARAYETIVKLEGATRDAAEYAALNATTASDATTQARQIVCVQFAQSATCSDPSVGATWASSTTSGGGTTTNPAVTVTVTSNTTFDTLVPYPFISGTGLALSTSSTFKVLQGR